MYSKEKEMEKIKAEKNRRKKEKQILENVEK
jgi:hypothetical protein